MHKPSLSWAAFDGFSDDELDRFLAGLSTPDELTRFQAYLAQHQAAAVWTKLFGSYEQGFASDLVTGNARARLAARLDGLSRGHRVFKEQSLRGWVWSVGVALSLAIGVMILGWNAGVHHVRERVATSPLVYTTANGQRATITLPDGSTAALDVASRLEVPADYVTGNHTVRLVGEGLFTVQHHQGTPFTVLAGAAAARVLGTSFLIRHYATDSLTTVAVRDGRVAVRTVVLTAGRQVAVGRLGVGPVQPADSAQFSFAKGVLTLDGVPFPDAMAELGRWYDADIRLGDPALATRRIAGEYAAGSLADVAAILEMTYNVRVVRNGRVLTLFSR